MRKERLLAAFLILRKRKVFGEKRALGNLGLRRLDMEGKDPGMVSPAIVFDRLLLRTSVDCTA
jgi:hypothetical protein